MGGRFVAVLFALLLVPAVAEADEISESVAACQGKSPGDKCKGGACVKKTCTRIDYAHWNRDASASPPTREYDCTECVADAKPTNGGCSMTAARASSWALACVPAIVLALLERRRIRR